MTNSAKLQTQLQTVLSGNAWYGKPIYTIIDGVSFEVAYEKAAGASNSIATILLHMLAWTEEVTGRMQGKAATTPHRGDWPDPGTPNEEKWTQLISFFKLANVELLRLIVDFPSEKWTDKTNDDRERYSG
jgi:uncharacterized damage-inducible protein DinB